MTTTMTMLTGQCAREVDGPIGTEFTYLFVDGDPRPGPAPVTFMGPYSNFQFDVSASLEPDTDLDGLGDETQDNHVQPRSCAGEEATIVGTGRPDKLRGTKGDDVIAARGGDDSVNGLKGDDLVCGGAGADVLRGRRGDDRLRGGRGKDELRGGRGSDRCRGGGGSDSKRRC
jgi:Ca2+-binding RTX toxin-like protein